MTVFHFSRKSNPVAYDNYLNKKIKKLKCKYHGLVEGWTIQYRPNGWLRLLRCQLCQNEYDKLLAKKNIPLNLIKKAKRSALEKKLKFSIKKKHISDLLIKQNNKCIYTKIDFDKSSNFPSIDRINSSKGYVINNVELILKPVNLMKQDMIKSDFINFCKLVNSPLKTKGNLSLLKYASNRPKKKDEQINDKKNFLSGRKVLCYSHGYHREFDLRNKTYVFCLKCRNENKIKKKLSRNDRSKKRRNNNIFSNIFRPVHLKRFGKFNLEFYDLIKLYIKQKGKCAITGAVFNNINNKPSVDRINPKIGYFKDNVHLVTYKVNRSKWNLEFNNFKRLCKIIAKNYS